MIQPLWKTGWQFLIKLNTHPPCDPAISLLCNYSNGMGAYVHKKDLHVNTSSSIIHKSPTLETTRRSIKRKMGDEIEVDSWDGTVRSNEKEPPTVHRTKGRTLGDIVLSSRSQGESSGCLIWFFYELQEQARWTCEDGIQNSGFFVGEEDIQERGIENFLRWLKCVHPMGVLVTWAETFAKTHWAVHLHSIYFIVCNYTSIFFKMPSSTRPQAGDVAINRMHLPPQERMEKTPLYYFPHA